MKVYFAFLILFVFEDCSYAQDVHKAASTKDAEDLEIMGKVTHVAICNKTDGTHENYNDVDHKKTVVSPDESKNFITKDLKNKMFHEDNVTILVNQTKKHVIIDLANKIETLTKSYLNDSDTSEERRIKLYRIKRRILELIQNYEAMQRNPYEFDEFTDLMTQGLNLAMKKLITSNTRNKGVLTFAHYNLLTDNSTLVNNTTHSGNYSLSGNNTRSGNNMLSDNNTLSGNNTHSGKNTLFSNNTLSGSKATSGNNTRANNDTLAAIQNKSCEVNEDVVTIVDADIIMKNNTSSKDTDLISIERIKQFEVYFNNILSETSINPSCDKTIAEICSRVQSVQKFSCSDGTTISLDQLCNGVPDCGDKIDERNCAGEVYDKMKQTFDIMLDVDKWIVNDCLPFNSQSDYLYNYKFLRVELKWQWKRQRKILLKQKIKRLETDGLIPERLSDEEAIMTTVISSFLHALQGDLCKPLDEIDSFHYLDDELKNIESEIFHDSKNDPTNNVTHSNWSPKSCTCGNQFCRTEDCNAECRRVCWQRHSLSRWECESYTGDLSVSLDLICDGKLDCFDESDETSCTTGLWETYNEAVFSYKVILGRLFKKLLSVDYKDTKEKMIIQMNIVRKLIDRFAKFDVDIQTIKKLRYKFFKMLVMIYDRMLQSSSMERLDKIFDFLYDLNAKMVYAMKRSHTGNTRVLLSNSCYCWYGISLLVHPLPICNKECVAEAMLLKYSCNYNNTFVYMIDICNGKNDCPNEEDEKNCKIDICKTRHLVNLRRNIEKAELPMNGTDLRQALDIWKTKAIASLISAESKYTIEGKFHDIINSVLRDLVTAYGSLQSNNSTSSEFILEEFVKMSNVVKLAFKTCLHKVLY